MPSAQKLEYKWFCCYCGDGPWSPFIVSCQNSFICQQHHRCNGCHVEVHRVPTGELWERTERGSYTCSGDAALRNDGSLEPHLQHLILPEETNVHTTFPELAEPHGYGEPLPQVSWPTEPPPGNTNTPAIPFHKLQTSDRLVDLGPLLSGLPKATFEAPTTSAWGLSEPYSTTIPTSTDYTIQSVWPTDFQSFQLEPFKPTVSEQWQTTSFSTIATTGQPQPPPHQQYSAHPSNPNPSFDQDTPAASRQKDDRSGLLACPFWKKDPHRAWSASSQACCTGHKRIRDVKQHIYRHHTTTVTTTTQKPSSRKTKRDGKMIERLVEILTEHQILQLRQYSKRNSGEMAQWYAIWDILFPKLSRPASPYVKDLEAELEDFRIFCLGQDDASAEKPGLVSEPSLKGPADLDVHVGLGLMTPLSPNIGSPALPLVPGDSLDNACPPVWETNGLYNTLDDDDDDDTSSQQYGGFGCRYDFLGAQRSAVPCVGEDTTGFWESGVQYIYQAG